MCVVYVGLVDGASSVADQKGKVGVRPEAFLFLVQYVLVFCFPNTQATKLLKCPRPPPSSPTTQNAIRPSFCHQMFLFLFLDASHADQPLTRPLTHPPVLLGCRERSPCVPVCVPVCACLCECVRVCTCVRAGGRTCTWFRFLVFFGCSFFTGSAGATARARPRGSCQRSGTLQGIPCNPPTRHRCGPVPRAARQSGPYCD